MPRGGSRGDATAASAAASPEQEEAAWRARMEERYGLDPAQFGEGGAGLTPGGAGDGEGEGGGGRRCSVM
jgi:hypothetical protein